MFLGVQRDGVGRNSALEVARKERAYTHSARDSESNSYQSVPEAEVPSPRLDKVCMLYKKRLVPQSSKNQRRDTGLA
jgi:hypothetical protein